MAVKGISALTWTATPKGINITDWSGKNPYTPMMPRGALMKIGGRQTGNALKNSLAQSARDGLPKAPPGGKINIAA